MSDASEYYKKRGPEIVARTDEAHEPETLTLFEVGESDRSALQAWISIDIRYRVRLEAMR